MENGGVTLDTRKYLMYKVYRHTAVYDALISGYLERELGIEFPDQIALAYEKKSRCVTAKIRIRKRRFTAKRCP